MKKFKVKKNYKHCFSCGYWWPYRFVNPMTIGGFGTMPVCALCADTLTPGGLQADIASDLLFEQQQWLNTPAGRRKLGEQYWQRRYIRFDYDKDKQTGGYVKMITTLVRFSYCNVFEPAETPSGDMKYSVSILIPKEDEKGINEINKAIQEAVQKGLEKNTFGKTHVKGLRLPLRDGSAEHEEGKRGPEYNGFFFLNASSKNQPGVVDTKLKPIMDTDEFYSGCWGRADINFFPYNQAGNRGIGVGLNNLMKAKDDDRLDGRMKAEDAFAQYAADGSDEPMADDLT